ncbi:MAG: ECF transporter S component [Dehalococcoidia bacterium]|nr:ECF transporter S component [Dehalococcoidia bacterium]
MALERPAARPLRLPLPSLGDVSFVALNLLGLLAYLHPFLSAEATQPDSQWFAHNTDGPLVFAAVAALCMVLLVAELTGGGLNSKSLAALGVLAAFAAVLRTITLPAGANLYFFLVILGSYAFGVRMGFLLGALSFFLSAIVTGGFGPWLPFQMFASAWMGASAAMLRPAAVRLRLPVRGEVALLVAFGVAWGLLFGAVTNLWSWPFWAGGPDITYEPGLGLGEAIRRYWNYYLVTSFGWDLLRSACNALAVAVLGGPLLRALVRYRQRFQWQPVERIRENTGLAAPKSGSADRHG